MTHVDSTKLIWGSMCIYIHDSMAFFPTKNDVKKYHVSLFLVGFYQPLYNCSILFGEV